MQIRIWNSSTHSECSYFIFSWPEEKNCTRYFVVDEVYKWYDLVPDRHGDVVLSAAILNPAAGLLQLNGSRPLQTGKDEDSEDIELLSGKS